MTQNKPIQLTPEGKANLEKELEDLVEVQRPKVVARVAETRAEGDLKENFGYHDARQELGMLDGRVETIQATLRNAVVVEPAPKNGTVQLLSSVTVADEWGESSYTIVGTTEANIAEGRISQDSPLGAALCGHRAGDVVEFEAPNGAQQVRITRVD